MTVKKAKPSTKSAPNNALCVPQKVDEREHLATARAVIAPDFRHGVTVAQIMKPQMGTTDMAPGVGDYADAIQEREDAAAKGDLGFASRRHSRPTRFTSETPYLPISGHVSNSLC